MIDMLKEILTMLLFVSFFFVVASTFPTLTSLLLSAQPAAIQPLLQFLGLLLLYSVVLVVVWYSNVDWEEERERIRKLAGKRSRKEE
jgi:flagellar biosynthesis protein FlhB